MPREKPMEKTSIIALALIVTAFITVIAGSATLYIIFTVLGAVVFFLNPKLWRGWSGVFLVITLTLTVIAIAYSTRFIL